MKKGYTLIEVLTTITIFLIISGSITGIFLSSVMAQRRALSAQKLFDNISYALEYMGRAMRMAKKELNCTDPTDPNTCSCLTTSGYGYNYEVKNAYGGTQNYIKFINYKGECQKFWSLQNRIWVETPSLGTSWLTPATIRVNVLRFNLFGEYQGDSGNSDILQPRVTIFLDAETEAFKPEAKVRIKIQTTISQRNLDVQE